MQTSFGDYQKESRKTYSHVPTNNHDLVYPSLGLSSEVGELMGKIKKVYRDKNGVIDAETKENMKGELGDILWYLTQICTNLNLTLEEIGEANLTKLFDRLKRGVVKGEGDNR